MEYIGAKRKSFFTRASLKLSSMLEERVFNDKTQEDFVGWCESVYRDKDPLDIAAHVLSEFHEKISEFELLRKPLYRVKKQLLSCYFAESLYKHICK